MNSHKRSLADFAGVAQGSLSRIVCTTAPISSTSILVDRKFSHKYVVVLSSALFSCRPWDAETVRRTTMHVAILEVAHEASTRRVVVRASDRAYISCTTESLPGTSKMDQDRQNLTAVGQQLDCNLWQHFRFSRTQALFRGVRGPSLSRGANNQEEGDPLRIRKVECSGG